jgi:NAD(P)H-flavin reductase
MFHAKKMLKARNKVTTQRGSRAGHPLTIVPPCTPHQQTIKRLFPHRLLWMSLSLCLLVTTELRAESFQYHARVVEIENLTHDTKRIHFRLFKAKHFAFQPGQYTFLKVPDGYVREWNARYHTSQKEVNRPYSFASSPSKLPLFDLIIKLATAPPGKDVPPGLASTFVHERLKVGDTVDFSPPTGELKLRKDAGRPILIVAGGTGAAPFVSLLEYWFENKFDRDTEIYFFFGVRSKRDLFLDSQFQGWQAKQRKFHYVPALSNPTSEDSWNGETGYIQSVVDKDISAPLDADAYLAGPPIMINEAVKVLKAKGIADDRIHYDAITVR